jgi:protein SCO1
MGATGPQRERSMMESSADRLWRLRAPLAVALGAALCHASGAAPAGAEAADPARAVIDPARLPAPGSYRLARIMVAPDGEVLMPTGQAVRLHRVLRGSLSVVSFIYSYCRDPEGCPRAWAVLETVRAELLRDPALAAQAQLVSLSFDPSHDTPAQMRLIGADRMRDTRVRWRFLTTASVPALLPLLRGFGQDVSVESDTTGRPVRTLNHLLKVFLVDEALQVREIYSVATLDPQAIVNDLRTLQMAQGGARA